jgi:hypothetical protein
LARLPFLTAYPWGISMTSFNFSQAFLSSVSPLEIFVRGTVVYIFIFILLRVVLK